MLDINTALAGNLKRLRKERRLSLDAVARACGVSKSMLAQIERGDVNPTLSTVWKIANGLKLSFTTLITRPETDVEIVRREDLIPLTGDEGRYRNFPVFPFSGERRFEMYVIELDPGCRLEAEAHPEGTEEFITVFTGNLSVTARGETFFVGAGDSLRFKADTTHVYANTGDVLCLLSMVIHYP